MNSEEWLAFLNKYATSSGAETWPGNPGATEEQLAAAEKQLKVTLPPSYRTFLSASNGWQLTSQTMPPLRAVDKIRWFRKEHPDWFGAYQQGAEPLLIPEQDYFNYSEPDSINFEIKHLAQTLCVSEIGDASVLLLNPMVVWPDGEWEVWFFANWLPGALRYRSFADWMRREFNESLNEPFQPIVNPGELPTVYMDAPTKADRRVRPREEVLVLEKVLAKLKSKKDRERVKAANQLARLGGKEAVDALLHALKNDPIREVRWAATDSLGYLREPDTIQALIAAAADPMVNSTAIHALAGFNDERSAQFLLKTLEACGAHAFTASGVLAKRKDARAIPFLVRFLTDTASKNAEIQHIGDIAGRGIAEFGEAGYAALEPLMKNPDRIVRFRAERGISDIAYCAKQKELRYKAFELLQRCFETEADDGLREEIGTSIEVSKWKNRK